MIRRNNRSRRRPKSGPTLESLEGRRLLSGRASESAFHAAGNLLNVKESDGRVALTITRDGDLAQPAAIRYATEPGTALAGYDYVPTSGVLSFAPGQTEAAITIAIVDDAIAEPLDYFSVVLTDPQGASYDDGPVYVAIADDEPASDSSPLFIDFGAYGLWTHNPVDGWSQVSPVHAETVVPTHRRDAFIDFGPGGLWRWDPQTGWLKLNDVDPKTVKLDANGDGVYVDFGPGGLWHWNEKDGYGLINAAAPEDFLIDRDGLTLDYGPAGLWRWNADGAWTKLNDADPEAMVGDPSDALFIDFGAAGLWSLRNGNYFQISDHDPRTMKLGRDLVDVGPHNLYENVLYLDFGPGGFWKWGDATGWAKLDDRAPESFVIGDSGDLFIDFGAAGLWSWNAADGAEQLNAVNPESLAFAAMDGSLFIDFGAAGLWSWTGNGGYAKLNDADPSALFV